MIGKLLADRFEILDRLGEGGMGVVYRARQISVDRVVAIKILNAAIAQDQQWVQRFINEGRACSKLQHPNTVRLIDFGQTRDGMLFMAMEFLDGQALRTVIDRGGRMHPIRVLKVVSQCCQSLGEAHGLGIIHRDIKPDNLFLVTLAGTPDFVKVLDFSVAKLRQQGSAALTQAGVVFGTPQYMSPEQGRGLPLDARSDIYAVGIVAYEMLMGHPPFASPNPMEVLAMHVRTPVPPLQGVPDRVAQVVMRALAKDPAHRQQTVEQLLAECQAALAEMGGQPLGPQQMPTQPGVGHVPAGLPGMGGAPNQVKTVFAGMQPVPQPGAQPYGGGAKTVMAGGMGPAQVPTMPSPGPMHTPQSPTPAQGPGTVLLADSEGIVSLADRQSASPLFWLVSIVCGIGVGVIAYLIIAAASG